MERVNLPTQVNCYLYLTKSFGFTIKNKNYIKYVVISLVILIHLNSEDSWVDIPPSSRNDIVIDSCNKYYYNNKFSDGEGTSQNKDFAIAMLLKNFLKKWNTHMN